MSQSMFFVVALAFFALPCVLGTSCYSCTPTESPVNLCDQMSALSMFNCSMENVSCARIEVMSTRLPNTKVYTFTCANTTDCVAYNSTACQMAMMQGNVTYCNTICCTGDNCNTFPVTPTPPVVMPTSSVPPGPPQVTTTPTAAGDKPRAYFGFLFVTLLTLVW